MNILPWTQRTFHFDLQTGLFPVILERLRTTPARAADILGGVPEEELRHCHDGRWSAKENMGHLDDLVLLDDKRLKEFLSGAPVLSAADPENLSTEAARHNDAPAERLLNSLRASRGAWTQKLESLTEEDLSRTALHPRLNQQLRLLDWLFFVAEHDDHHLALARQAILNADKLAGHDLRTASSDNRPACSTESDSLPCMRDWFEIPEDVTYLNCANMAPQLKNVTAAGIDAVRAKATPWRLSAPEWFSGAETLRSLAAQVIGCDADGVALVPAASYGIAVAAANLPLASGQTIVVLDQEFPSNFYAWRTLARNRGGRVVMVKRQNGETWTEALLREIDEHTGIVAIPQCHWTDGAKIDLDVVAARVREAGAALVIDASQSLGAYPLNVQRVQPDFLVSVGYKWLLGPYGLGYLYVAEKWRQSGVPLEQSWLIRAGSEDFSKLMEYTDDYRAGARRFDMGEFPQFVLAPMAIEALKQVLNWRVDRIQTTLSILTAKVAEEAAKIGYSVLPAEHRVGHLIGIRPPAHISPGMIESLKNARIFVSIRGDSIRIAPHVYNTAADVDRLFEILRQQPR